MKTTVAFEVDVPEADWIELLTQCNDVFGRSYCGYWLRGAEFNPQRGWLVWEEAGSKSEGCRFEEEPDREEAIEAWIKGKPLPPGWYRLDKDVAIKAYVEGVKRWGIKWMEGEHGDACGYDIAIQSALLGEVRYG